MVYYAPRKEKTWTVHSSCKLTPEPKARVANTRCGLANFTPVERILICSTRSVKCVGIFSPVGRRVRTLRAVWSKCSFAAHSSVPHFSPRLTPESPIRKFFCSFYLFLKYTLADVVVIEGSGAAPLSLILTIVRIS